MIFKFGTLRDTNKISPQIISENVLEAIRNDLMILDREYGEERNIDNDDGGYILYCTADTTIEELRSTFDTREHVLEWAGKINSTPPYCIALYLMTNDYAIEVVMPLSKADADIQAELS